MFLGSRNDVLRQIRRITAAQPHDEALGVAVAFWGSGSQQLIIPDRRFQIICNLFHLGTNPYVIRQLKARANAKIKHRRGTRFPPQFWHGREGMSKRTLLCSRSF